jgi:serine/threonine-protein kinase
MPAAPRTSSPALTPATEQSRLGRYQLLQKLASGGMASVYLARAEGAAGFEKVFALKRIHPHLASEKHFVDMFLDEARIASRIDHANVCSVFDFGEADGTYYIAMEFLAGESLSQIAKHMARSSETLRSPRRAWFVARIIADVCEGLHAAHELRGRDGELLNVVHRDISPQNLFITYDGVVKVVDFGIASAADRLHHTQGSEVKGKFSYMAPEQARGTKGAKLDRRADVFALGIVLWELLVLKRLFRRDTPAETLLALMNDPIPAPSTQRAGVPVELDAIVLKALARKPDERYPNARELGRDLARAIGKAGEVIGGVDLAEWLDTLAPGARELSRRQIEGALQGDAPRGSLPPAGEVSGSDIVALDEPAEPTIEPSISEDLAPSNAHAHIDDGDDELATVARFPSAGKAAGGIPVPALATGAAGVVGASASASRGGLAGIVAPPRVDPPVGRRGPAAPPLVRPSTPEPAQNTGAFATAPVPDAPVTAGPRVRPIFVLAAVAVSAAVIGVALAVGVSFGQRDALRQVEESAPAPVAGAAPTAGEPVVSQPVVPAPMVPTPAVPVPMVPAPTVAVPGAAGSPAAGPAGASATPAAAPTGLAAPIPTSPREASPARRPTPARPAAPVEQVAAALPTAAAPAAGTVIVTTPGGWANVFDRAGRLLGQTPLRAQIPAGTHTLSLRPFGQPPAITVSVEVMAGGTARVSRPLEE